MWGRTRRGEERYDFFFFKWPLQKNLQSDLNGNGTIVKFLIKHVSLAHYFPRNPFFSARLESIEMGNHFLEKNIPDGGS